MNEIIGTDNLCGQIIGADRRVVFDARTNATMAVSGNIITLTPDHAKRVAGLALRDMLNFGPREFTLAEHILGGLPTAIARVDCTVDVDGNIISYETEERPAGLGVVEKMSSELDIPDGQNPSRLALCHLEDTFGSLPISLLEPGSPPNDDVLVFPQGYLSNSIDLGSIGPVLVRANPNTVLAAVGDIERLRELQRRSVSTIATEGSKRYRLASDDAERFDPNNPPNKDFPFVYKPIQGSKAKGLGVYIPNDYDDGGRFSQIQNIPGYGKAIETMQGVPDGYIIEPFYPGIEVTANGLAANAILRIYVALGYDAISEEYSARVLGGAIVARPGLIVHGRSDAVAGVVLAPDPTNINTERIMF